jgi:hypothetical protein
MKFTHNYILNHNCVKIKINWRDAFIYFVCKNQYNNKFNKIYFLKPTFLKNHNQKYLF